MSESEQLARTAVLCGIAFFLVVLAAMTKDDGFAVHAWIGFNAVAGFIVYYARRFPKGHSTAASGSVYLDGVVKAGMIATVFWGLACFLVGVVIGAGRGAASRPRIMTTAVLKSRFDASRINPSSSISRIGCVRRPARPCLH